MIRQWIKVCLDDPWSVIIFRVSTDCQDRTQLQVVSRKFFLFDFIGGLKATIKPSNGV